MADIIEQSDMLLKDFNSSGYISKYVMEALPQLVAEIKRLQAQVEFQSESIQILCRDLDPQLHHLMKGKQELREQLATLQKIAIKHLAWAKFVEDELDAIPQEKNYEDYREKYEREAAKALGLQVTREAGYLERLERLALSLCMEAGWGQEDFEAALEKIRKG